MTYIDISNALAEEVIEKSTEDLDNQLSIIAGVIGNLAEYLAQTIDG